MPDDKALEDKPFHVEIVKQRRAVCKRCGDKFEENDFLRHSLPHLRISKTQANASSSNRWHHIDCIFEAFLTQKQTTRRIHQSQDIQGWDSLKNADQDYILKKIEECNKTLDNKMVKNSKNKVKSQAQLNTSIVSEDCVNWSSDNQNIYKDNYFYLFTKIVSEVANVSSPKKKIKILRDLFAKGKEGFKGDIYLWCKLLLPTVEKREYSNLDTTKLLKLFSIIFNMPVQIQHSHDIGQTIHDYYGENRNIKPAKQSSLTIYEVDNFLETLQNVTDEEGQLNCFRNILSKCTANDLKFIIRLINHDLRMNLDNEDVLEGFHGDANMLYQQNKSLKTIVNKCWNSSVKMNENEKCSRRKSSSQKQLQAKKIKTEKLNPYVQIEELIMPATKGHKPIPKYFESARLLLEEGVNEKFGEWVRYFIAYGGKILDSNENQEATHVLHLNDSVSGSSVPCAVSARHVIVQWIKDTVEKESLQDYKPYSVRWLPNKI